MADIDWELLRTKAIEASTRAYAPYSKFHVGAAGLTTDGRVVTGCNVENVSYGLGLCAECGLVSELHSSGGGQLLAVSVVSGTGEYCAPCGRCRQLLIEHGGSGLLIDNGGVPITIADLLPDAFTPERLAEDD